MSEHILKYPDEQTDPPRPPWETLPTMYDLPSEKGPEEPGLPDEFHDIQPQLLSATFRLQDYGSDQIFTGSDLNLYYDVRHQLWYKRPDWFVAVGVPRLYREDMRLSYVMWQEGVSPYVVVELISPGTEKEDLGQTPKAKAPNTPPGKWQVYEQILRVPYYIVFDRYQDSLRVFHLINGAYEQLNLPENRLWIPQLKIGLGTWHGEYQGIERLWLRWFDETGHWISTAQEKAATAEQAATAAEQALLEEQQKSQRLADKLRALGIDPDQV